jgi:hypothetical protein
MALGYFGSPKKSFALRLGARSLHFRTIRITVHKSDGGSRLERRLRVTPVTRCNVHLETAARGQALGQKKRDRFCDAVSIVEQTRFSVQGARAKHGVECLAGSVEFWDDGAASLSGLKFSDNDLAN